MKIRSYFLIACVLLPLIMAPTSVMAAIDTSDTTAIHEDYYLTLTLPMTNDGQLIYTATVTDGPNIDIALFDSTEYPNYVADKSSKYLVACSNLNTNKANIKCDLPAGTYYLVFDNTDYGSASPPWNGVDDIATVTYHVQTKDVTSTGENAINTLVWIFVIVIILVLVIVVVVLLMRKRGHQQQGMPPQPQQYQSQPPAQQYAPPPQQYQPQPPAQQYAPPPQQYQSQPPAQQYAPPPQQYPTQYPPQPPR